MTVTPRGTAASVPKAHPTALARRQPAPAPSITQPRAFGHPMESADRLVVQCCIFVVCILPLVVMMEGGAA